jgi:hypothetical protein
MKKDRFGMLFVPIKVVIPNRIIISPVNEFAEIKKEYKKFDDNGFMNPPICQKVTYVDGSKSDIIEGPKKQAEIYQLHSTHVIEYSDEVDEKTFRTTTGRFIIGLLEVLFDARLQWEGWWHEDRIPMKNECVCTIVNGENIDFLGRVIKQKDQLSQFFSDALSIWDDELDEKSKKIFLNAIYYHQKAIGYKWGFEKYTVDYYAVDAIWRFGVCSKKWKDTDEKGKNIPHGKRLEKMIQALNLFDNEDKRNEIVNTRNDLFHEANWGDGNPIDIGYKNCICFVLHRLVKRLILAAIGTRNEYTRSSWITLSPSLWE